MIQFVFVIPTRNSVKTLRQAIASMAFQSYPHWRAIIIDDCSTDGTPDVIEATIKQFGIVDKFIVLRNKERLWEVANVLQAMTQIDDSEIVCRLDLDDYLCDLNALEIMAQAYTKFSDLDVAYSKHRWFDDEQLTNFNISAELPANADPYIHPWVTSHFKTFRRSTLKNVKYENYRDANGEYFKRIGDQAFMLPALKNARRWLFIQQSLYAYRCDLRPETFQTEDAKYQAAEAEHLRKRGYIS
jgi:glycosyltransferase involved in cell wall biosynthesis